MIGWEAKAAEMERGTGAGGGRRIVMSAVWLLKAVVANATAPLEGFRERVASLVAPQAWLWRFARS